ncbi:MAG TPA: class I adenylate-forming enzyme family protein [Holophagaceae bacterium]|nr:class I adenylate-forming enzyme family protein [Holophagaceae bacterium]
MATHHHRLVQDGLFESSRLAGAKEALVTEGLRLSYTDLLDRALRLARALQDRGLQPGDRVAVFMDNGVDAVASIYGAWIAGGVVMVLNPQTKADKLAYLLEDSAARILLAQGTQQRTVQRALEGLRPGAESPAVLLSGAPSDSGFESLEAALRGAPAAPCEPGTLATDLAALIYTSGSTGQPKGVMVTHQNMTFTLGSLTEYLRLGSEDRILNLLPLAFDYGLYQLLMAVRLGATLVLEQGFGYPAVIEQRIREEGITVFPGVPTVFSTLLSRSGGESAAFPTVRRVTNTAAALSPELIPALRRKFPQALIFKMYGLTECKRVCYLEPEELPHRPDSVGKAIPGTQVFLQDPEGRPVPPGEPGILHVRGPHVMVGYWNKPEQTAHMLRPGRHAAERVLCTHDFFRMDAEGYLYFVGRTDDIIKTRGEKVSPVEVENVLYGIAGVRDAAVVGVPDPTLGEAIRAFIALAPGATLTEREIRRICQERLEGFMIPKEIVLLPELPKTDTGKVRKKDLLNPDLISPSK